MTRGTAIELHVRVLLASGPLCTLYNSTSFPPRPAAYNGSGLGLKPGAGRSAPGAFHSHPTLPHFRFHSESRSPDDDRRHIVLFNNHNIQETCRLGAAPRGKLPLTWNTNDGTAIWKRKGGRVSFNSWSHRWAWQQRARSTSAVLTAVQKAVWRVRHDSPAPQALM